MSKKDLIKKINELDDQGFAEDADSLFDNYLELHPDDIDMLLRQATYLLGPPLGDYLKALDCIDAVLSIDSNNIEACLLWACALNFMLGDVDSDVFNKLSKIETNDPDKQSMIEYVKSWYYRDRNMHELYEKALINSINIYSYNVWNYRDLGRFYMEHGRKDEGQKLIKKAMDNVKNVFPDNYDYSNYDLTDVQSYFDSLIRGTRITYAVSENLDKELLEAS